MAAATILARTAKRSATGLAAFLDGRLGLGGAANGVVDVREVLEVVLDDVLGPELAGVDAGEVLLQCPDALAVGGVLVDHGSS